MAYDRKAQNTTNYEHPQESHLYSVHYAMKYNGQGEPLLRTTLGSSASDAFGRLRVSSPYTLFDSFHRYQDNGKITESKSATGATSVHNANAGCIELTLDTATGSHVFRESSRVFAYQPGKSLQILQTFVMAPAKAGLRQRFGYFDTQNGVFLEQENDTISFVKRAYTTGTAVDTKISQANWNIDRLDGTGPSNITLDLSKAQIMFIDIEWLGVGSIRCGFVIDGNFIECHKFHHANSVTAPYMTTACLPVRCEIENTGTTASASTLRVICTSVMSEGGYEVRGRSFSAGHVISSPYGVSSSGTVYPLISLRLKPDRLGAIVDPKTFSIAVGSASNYQYRLIAAGATAGGTWISAGVDSAVEYNLTATSITAGRTLDSSYIIASNQTASAPQNAGTPFKYQLERNSFTGTCYEFIIAIVSSGNNNTAWGSIQWEEVT